MHELSDAQLEFIREDIDHDMMYTKIRMINELIGQIKKDDPDLTPDAIMEKIKEFRQKNGWDK